MGRKKITIELIQDERNRQVTFTKRKYGLLKKARELSILCGAEIAVVIFSNGGGQSRLNDYCSHDITETLVRLANFEGTVESRDNVTYNSQVPPYSQSCAHDDPRAPLTRAAALAALATTRRQRVHHNLPHDPNMPFMPNTSLSNPKSHFLHLTSMPSMSAPDDQDMNDDDDDDDDERESRDMLDVPNLPNAHAHNQYCNGNAKSSNNLSNGLPKTTDAIIPGNASVSKDADSSHWGAPLQNSTPHSQPMQSRNTNPHAQNPTSQPLSKQENVLVKQEQLVSHGGLPSTGRNSFPPFSTPHVSEQQPSGRPEPIHPPATPLPSPRTAPSPRNSLSNAIPSPRPGIQGSRTLPSPRILPSPHKALPSPRDMFKELSSPRPPPSSTPITSQPADITRPNFGPTSSTQPQRRPRPTGSIPPRHPMKWQKHLTIQIPKKNADPPSPGSAKRRPSDSVLSALPSGTGLSPHPGGWTPDWSRSSQSQQVHLAPFRGPTMSPTSASEAFPTIIATPRNGDIPADPLATPKATATMCVQPSAGTAYPPFPSPTSNGLLPIMSRSLAIPLVTPTSGQATGFLGKRSSPDRLDGIEAHGPPSARSKLGESFLNS